MHTLTNTFAIAKTCLPVGREAPKQHAICCSWDLLATFQISFFFPANLCATKNCTHRKYLLPAHPCMTKQIKTNTPCGVKSSHNK